MNPSNTQIVFTQPGVVALQPAPRLAAPLKPTDVLIETEFSIVSPGTELACLSGKESWAPLPFVPGYGSVGRVSEVGSEVKHLTPGQRIFTYGRHSRFSLAEALFIPLNETIDPAKAVFARMAAVSITALRVADVALGDTVAVFGLGPVGNLAAQLFALSGCDVIGIDLSPKRRELARQCGIPHVFSPGENLKQQIADLTHGQMCRTVVEATGVAAVAEQAGALAGKLGELILLGSPRGEYTSNLTPFLNRTHLWDNGCITVKGAHEWRFPVLDDASGHGRHSMERNVQTILKLIEGGKLKIDPLFTHRVAPTEAATVYEGLKNQKDTYIGVVFDWSAK